MQRNYGFARRWFPRIAIINAGQRPAQIHVNILPNEKINMKSNEFNKRFPVGSVFIHQPNPALRGGRTVRTVGKANDFPSGCIVEINVVPYFAKAEHLKPA